MMKKKKNRIVWLRDEIRKDSEACVVKELINFDLEDNSPIWLFINSIGGYLRNGIIIQKLIIHNIKSPVITIGCGEVRSEASAMLACGAIRLIFSETKIMYHFPTFNFKKEEKLNAWNLSGMSLDLISDERRYLERCTLRLPTHLRQCKLDKDDLKKRIANRKSREYEIDAATARNEGFVDGIITNVNSIPKFEQKLIRRLEQLKK